MDTNKPDLTLLLQRCAAQDEPAFRQLYDVLSSRMYGVALRITRQPQLAADAVHDAYLQVWRQSAKYDPERGNAEAWLLALVRYRALDITRRRVREVVVDEVPEQTDTDPDPLSRLQGATEAEALHRCLAEVEPERRRLVVLAFVDGLSHSELAERVGQPLGTVKSTIRRALQALRGCLERHEGART